MFDVLESMIVGAVVEAYNKKWIIVGLVNSSASGHYFAIEKDGELPSTVSVIEADLTKARATDTTRESQLR